jgi:hypothetical protein
MKDKKRTLSRDVKEEQKTTARLNEARTESIEKIVCYTKLSIEEIQQL